jgi:RNA polymerase sigma factor (sigma-70 family)
VGSGFLIHRLGGEMEYDIRDFFTTESLESIDGIEDFVDIERAFNRLPEREKKIVYLRLSGYTQEEIGAIIGVTHQHISRILAKMCKTIPEMAQD